MLILEGMAPRKEGEEWKFSVLATVRGKRGPVTQLAVGFYLNGVLAGEEMTDEFGVATHEFAVASGVYIVHAKAGSESRSLSVEALEKRSTPHAMRVTRIGSRGKYLFRFLVTTEDGKPVPGVAVEILKDASEIIVLNPTGADGMTEWEANILPRKKKWVVSAAVRGTAIRKRLMLFKNV